MKQIAFLLLMMLLCTSVFSQQKDIETEDTTGISAYISPFFETTSMIKSTSFIGGIGGILITPNIIVGGFGKAMTSYFKIDSTYNKSNNAYEHNLELDFGGGGLVIGYIFMPAKKVHPIIMLWAGGGSISLSNKNKTRIKELYDDFWLYNGTIEIDYRPLKFLSFGIGAHYQMVSGLKLDGYSNENFNGAGLFVNIKAGSF